VGKCGNSDNLKNGAGYKQKFSESKKSWSFIIIFWLRKHGIEENKKNQVPVECDHDP
jgi:hypothetical protein